MVLRIEQRLARHLGGPGAARLAHDDRIHPASPHPLGQRPQQRGLARALGTLQDDEEPARVIPA